MAAPTGSLRQVPSGTPLGDGYRTLISFKKNTDVSFWEKTVTPMGYDGGDAIDVSTMHNDTWRTFRPRSLVTLTEATITAAYDPALVDQVKTLVNVEDEITVFFPDGQKIIFYGYLRTFTPDSNEEGAQPTATIVIQPTNWDPVNSVEAAPVLGTYTLGTGFPAP